ncbi:MAG: SDR family NAD(P)-dependent oxidoreductase, partial [Haliea sp.]|nr:SDR family NAD(P)-dependent oxidoreductase [Haliea sp.]
MRLQDKVALITGAASGIGASAVERFIAEGCKVCLCDIQDEAGEALAASYGDQAMYVHCNITDE